MKSTFTAINGTKFESNDSYTYFYATFTNPVTEQITKKRISKHDFEQAKKEDEIIRANLERMAIEAEAEKAIEEQDAQQELVAELNAAVEKKATPKAKKSSKKAAYQSRIVVADDKVADVTLTEKQVDFIRHLPDTYFWQDGVESVIWIDCLCDDIKGQFAGKPMTVGAMISTLCEKDLGLRTTCRRENRKCVSFELTELGQLVAKELGLN